MADPREGTFRVGTVLGFPVRFSVGWLIGAATPVLLAARWYTSPWWAVVEYVGIFVLIFLHELGHALAGRAVGADVDGILLHPFGGATMVQLPQRPVATLLTVGAGPLVNLLAVPALALIGHVATDAGIAGDPLRLIRVLQTVNTWLLLLNLLPVFPLDGGRLLWALLWAPLGRARALRLTGALGVVGVLAMASWRFPIGLATLMFPILLVAAASLIAWQTAAQVDRIPGAWHHLGVRCPRCGEAPPEGPFWTCACGVESDPFLMEGECPSCRRVAPRIACLRCGDLAPLADWRDGSGVSPMTAAPPETPQRASA